MKFAHAVAGTMIGIFICSTSIFQQIVFPGEYWAKELIDLEQTAQFVAEEARLSELRGNIEEASILKDVLRGLDDDIAEAKQRVR